MKFPRQLLWVELGLAGEFFTTEDESTAAVDDSSNAGHAKARLSSLLRHFRTADGDMDDAVMLEGHNGNTIPPMETIAGMAALVGILFFVYKRFHHHYYHHHHHPNRHPHATEPLLPTTTTTTTNTTAS